MGALCVKFGHALQQKTTDSCVVFFFFFFGLFRCCDTRTPHSLVCTNSCNSTSLCTSSCTALWRATKVCGATTTTANSDTMQSGRSAVRSVSTRKRRSHSVGERKPTLVASMKKKNELKHACRQSNTAVASQHKEKNMCLQREA